VVIHRIGEEIGIKEIKICVLSGALNMYCKIKKKKSPMIWITGKVF